MKLPEVLTKQVGPLPVGAWVAVVGAGLWIGSRFSGGGEPGDAEPVEEPEIIEPPEGSRFVSVDRAIGAGSTQEGFADNVEWRRAAHAYLVGQRRVNALLADAAFNKYLSGERLNTEERRAIVAALGALGLPPDPPDTQYSGGGRESNGGRTGGRPPDRTPPPRPDRRRPRQGYRDLIERREFERRMAQLTPREREAFRRFVGRNR